MQAKFTFLLAATILLGFVSCSSNQESAPLDASLEYRLQPDFSDSGEEAQSPQGLSTPLTPIPLESSDLRRFGNQSGENSFQSALRCPRDQLASFDLQSNPHIQRNEGSPSISQDPEVIYCVDVAPRTSNSRQESGVLNFDLSDNGQIGYRGQREPLSHHDNEPNIEEEEIIDFSVLSTRKYKESKPHKVKKTKKEKKEEKKEKKMKKKEKKQEKKRGKEQSNPSKSKVISYREATTRDSEFINLASTPSIDLYRPASPRRESRSGKKEHNPKKKDNSHHRKEYPSSETTESSSGDSSETTYYSSESD